MKNLLLNRSTKIVTLLLSLVMIFTFTSSIVCNATESETIVDDYTNSTDVAEQVKLVDVQKLPYSGSFSFTESNTGNIFYSGGNTIHIDVTSSCPETGSTWNILVMSTSSTIPKRILYIDSNGSNSFTLTNMPIGEYYLRYLGDSYKRNVSISIYN